MVNLSVKRKIIKCCKELKFERSTANFKQNAFLKIERKIKYKERTERNIKAD